MLPDGWYYNHEVRKFGFNSSEGIFQPAFFTVSLRPPKITVNFSAQPYSDPDDIFQLRAEVGKYWPVERGIEVFTLTTYVDGKEHTILLESPLFVHKEFVRKKIVDWASLVVCLVMVAVLLVVEFLLIPDIFTLGQLIILVVLTPLLFFYEHPLIKRNEYCVFKNKR
jgi:hypothetical protein